MLLQEFPQTNPWKMIIIETIPGRPTRCRSRTRIWILKIHCVGFFRVWRLHILNYGERLGKGTAAYSGRVRRPAWGSAHGYPCKSINQFGMNTGVLRPGTWPSISKASNREKEELCRRVSQYATIVTSVNHRRLAGDNYDIVDELCKISQPKGDQASKHPSWRVISLIQ